MTITGIGVGKSRSRSGTIKGCGPVDDTAGLRLVARCRAALAPTTSSILAFILVASWSFLKDSSRSSLFRNNNGSSFSFDHRHWAASVKRLLLEAGHIIAKVVYRKRASFASYSRAATSILRK